ncbi:MAG: LytR/AlgR family response regulator transcription factor [Flavobacteriales bacterium]
MRKLRTVVVDDEEIARTVLQNYLTKYCGDSVEILSVCDGFHSAIEFLRTNDIDLLFLDIEMPYGNGLDVLESLGEYQFKVVFTTAFDQYAIEALHQHAFDYLMKPIGIKKLIKTVEDVSKLHQKAEENTEEFKSNVSSKFLKVPSQKGFQIVNKTDIRYAKAADNYCELHLIDGQKLILSQTLKRIENELINQEFIRVHKSYLVNAVCIAQYNRAYGGSLVLDNGFELPISASGKKNLNVLF